MGRLTSSASHYAVLVGGLLIGCALLLQGCITAPITGYEHLNEQIDKASRQVGLGPGDVFEVRVYGEKELSGLYRVTELGDIRFPLIETVHVGGKLPDQIAGEIRERLQNGFIREPFVSVYVKEYNSKKILVLGEVNKPGSFPFEGGMNVVEAISLAGGFKTTANRNYVVVTREIDGKATPIPVPVEKISEGRAENLLLRAGDIVFIRDTLL